MSNLPPPPPPKDGVQLASPNAANPANPPLAELAAQPQARKRIPMSTPQRKLEVPSLPGFVLFWFKEENVLRAQQAGYEFVNRGEIPVHQVNVGNSKALDGNVDLGSHVRVQASVTSGGDGQYAVLMKIRQEWYDEDQASITNRNTSIMQAIFTKEHIAGSEQVQDGADKSLRYVKTAKTSSSLLNRGPRKAQTQG